VRNDHDKHQCGWRFVVQSHAGSLNSCAVCMSASAESSSKCNIQHDSEPACIWCIQDTNKGAEWALHATYTECQQCAVASACGQPSPCGTPASYAAALSASACSRLGWYIGCHSAAAAAAARWPQQQASVFVPVECSREMSS
jgi:hypothetical protein